MSGRKDSLTWVNSQGKDMKQTHEKGATIEDPENRLPDETKSMTPLPAHNNAPPTDCKPALMVGGDVIENAEAVGRLKQLYREAQQGLRLVVSLGIYCYHIKERLKKGEFQPWLAKNCPDLSYRSL